MVWVRDVFYNSANFIQMFHSFLSLSCPPSLSLLCRRKLYYCSLLIRRIKWYHFRGIGQSNFKCIKKSHLLKRSQIICCEESIKLFWEILHECHARLIIHRYIIILEPFKFTCYVNKKLLSTPNYHRIPLFIHIDWIGNSIIPY